MIKFDDIGPEKILEVYDAETKMHGFVVIDNTKRGPGKGGIRLTNTVSIDEVAKLARAMTYKNALAGLPFGGAKAGIQGTPGTIIIGANGKREFIGGALPIDQVKPLIDSVLN